MKILLDENLPKKLKKDFPEHEIYTVKDKSWVGEKNGELIEKMLKENFQVLITFDKNLEYQQNFSKFPIIVLTINAEDNTYLTLKEFVLTIRKKLKENLNPGVQIID